MFLCRNKKNTNNIYYWFRGEKKKKKKKRASSGAIDITVFFFVFFLHHQNIPCWCSVVWILMSTNKIVSAQKWTKSYLPNHPLSALTILRLMIELAGGNIWAISGDCSFRCVHSRKTDQPVHAYNLISIFSSFSLGRLQMCRLIWVFSLGS